MRQRTFRRKPERLFHECANRCKIDNRISERRHRASRAPEQIDVTQKSRSRSGKPSRRCRAYIISAFKQSEIDVRRTFRRATFARETIAQRRVELLRFQRIVAVHAQFQRRANDVGASARRHDFIAGGDECRAHHRRVFAAAAAAVALLEIADERAVFERKREPRLERQFDRRGEIIAQVIVDLVPTPVRLAPVAENFSGIENVFRIERRV